MKHDLILSKTFTKGKGPTAIIIKGENYFALKLLAKQYARKIQCVYIDPPYNTKREFENYSDSLDSHTWCHFLKLRLEAVKPLVAVGGWVVIQISDAEIGNAVVTADQVLGKANRVNIIVVKMSNASGVKMVHAEYRLPKLKEYLIVYANGKSKLNEVEMLSTDIPSKRYNKKLVGITSKEIEFIRKALSYKKIPYETFNKVRDIVAKASLANASQKEIAAKANNIVGLFNSDTVLAFIKTINTKQHLYAYLSPQGKLVVAYMQYPKDLKMPSVQMLFSKGLIHPGDLWTEKNHTDSVSFEGKVTFKNGKKGEHLISKILRMYSREGDTILDMFGGSGTTSAVATKLGRNSIALEKGPQFETHMLPRLKSVITNKDNGGITKIVNYKGGGTIKAYELFVRKNETKQT